MSRCEWSLSLYLEIYHRCDSKNIATFKSYINFEIGRWNQTIICRRTLPNSFVKITLNNFSVFSQNLVSSFLWLSQSRICKFSSWICFALVVALSSSRLGFKFLTIIIFITFYHVISFRAFFVLTLDPTKTKLKYRANDTKTKLPGWPSQPAPIVDNWKFLI